MLNRNYADTIASIANKSASIITPKKNEDYIAIMRQAGEDYQKGKQLQADNAFTEEMVKLHPEDEAKIRQMGGRAYADVMQAREWQLADADTQFARQKELANINFNNNMALKRLEASLKPATTAQQNMEYLIKQGYSPEEAAQLYYSGQNPNLNVMALGQKGQEAYEKKIGEDLAKMQEQNRLSQESDDRLNALKDHLQSNPTTVGIYAPVQAFATRLNPNPSSKDREWLKARGYSSRALGEVQNALIAEAKSAGQTGINTAREIEQATKGLNENSSLPEVLGALDAMQASIGRLRQARANRQTPTPIQRDWSKASNEDILKGL